MDEMGTDERRPPADAAADLRIVVVGTSGSGKSTVAARAAGRLGVPYIDLDDLFWNPGWVQTPDPEFLAKVEAVTAGSRWVVAGNYSRSQHIVWPRTTAIVWLDLPRPVVMNQLIRRTLRRAITQEECCNGNRESPGQWLRRDENVVLWAWRTHGPKRELYSAAMAGDDRWVRLTSRSEIDAWVGSLPVTDGAAT